MSHDGEAADIDHVQETLVGKCSAPIEDEDSGPTVIVAATTMGGHRVSTEVPVAAKLQRVRRELAPNFGVQPDQLKLTSGELLLEDDCKLMDLGVKDLDFSAIIGMPGEVEKRIQELMDPKSGVRQQAARRLGMMGEASFHAIPALEGALQDDHEDVRIEAAAALGLLGPKAASAVDALQAALDRHVHAKQAKATAPKETDGLPETARFFPASVLGALGRIGEAGVPPLVQAMKVQDLRGLAVTALGEAGEAAASAVPDLVWALRDDRKDICQKAAKSIANIGQAAMPALEEMLGHRDSEVCDVAAAALGSFGKVAINSLEKAIASSNPSVRVAAASALGLIPEKVVVQLLERVLLEDKDWGVCVATTAALGRLGEVGISSLEQALKIDYWAVQDKLVEILENAGEGAVPLLERMLRSQDLAICLRMRAIAALGRIGVGASEAVATLASQLLHLPPCLRKEVAGTLRMLGEAASPAVPELLAVLRCTEQPPEARAEAAEALASIGSFAVPELGALLRPGNDAFTCRLAADALGMMGAVAVPTLVAALEEPDTRTREDCARALGAIGEEAAPAVPALARLFDDVYPWVRWEAAEALGRIHSGGLAIPVLVQAMGDPCESVRVAATVALGKQGAGATVAAEALNYAMQDPELCSHAQDALMMITWAAKKCAAAYTRRKLTMVALALFE